MDDEYRAFPWIVLGLAEALERRPLRRTTVAEFAVQLASEIGPVAQRLANDLTELRRAHLGSWAENRDGSEALPDHRAVAALLQRALDHAFDGVDLLMLKRGPGGSCYERISKAVLGEPDDEPTQQDQIYAASLLETAVELASSLLEQYRLSAWFRKRYSDLGTDVQRAACYEELPLEADGVAGRFLRDNFGASEAEVELHVRKWACAQEANRKPRRFGGGSMFMTLAEDVDEELEEISELQRALGDAVERLPEAHRLEKLLLTDLEDTLLLALQMRSEVMAQGPHDLVLHFAKGMRRLNEIEQRITELGDAAGIASFFASAPLSVADFDAAEAEIGTAVALLNDAKAEPASAEPPKALWTCGFSRDPEDLLRFSRDRVKFSLEVGDAQGHSAALAELGNELFERRNNGSSSPTELLREAIECWQLALQGTWTPATAVRKWAALTHNIGLAEICIGEIDGSQEQIEAGLDTIGKAAAALDPEQHLWNHFAIRHTALTFSHLVAWTR